jgi:hypothetical protein
MKKYLLPLFLLLTVFSLNSHARKPAVEPISGVEPESYNTTSTGVEVQFNFGNHIYANKLAPGTSKSSETSTPSTWVPAFTLISFILLPFMMWFFINKSAEESLVAETANKAKYEATNQNDHETYADTISQDNVESLSAHRKDQNNKDKTKKAA